ncbi:MAG TPA: hypothetical protein PK503_00875 [Azonexus sp.]|nr:hypothetical protein [Azonexus sp.]
MIKQITVTKSEIEDYKQCLRKSADQTRTKISGLARGTDSLEFLSQLKFQAIGCDPLNTSRQLNLIEQLNQTFTYLASFDGAAFLFSQHPKLRHLTLNLGTSPGSDIESSEEGGIAAEVFASVDPRNNRKLANDIEKVSRAKAKHRYVLFMSHDHKAGYFHTAGTDGITVWSLGHST